MKRVTKEMKILTVVIALVMILLMTSGVFAVSVGTSGNSKKAVSNVAEKKIVSKSNIQTVEEINLENLPVQVKLGNIHSANITIYKVNSGTNRPFFVLSAKKF